MVDRNFDDIADKFTQNIYGTTKGKIREAVIWQDLNSLLDLLPNKPLKILDAGGGEGFFASKLAAMGHQVIVCDISATMLERAKLLAKEKKVSHNMQFIHFSVQNITQYLTEMGAVDLVLFHAVIEWISEQKSAIKTLADIINPGGAFSIMFYNANGLVMRNAVLGNFHLATPNIQRRRKRSLTPLNPLLPETVYQWLAEFDFRIVGKTGVRVFHDYLQSRQLQNKDFPALLALEQRYCRQQPYIDLGRYIHVMACKSM